MMTDVMALKELGIECAMANISCGYYNPHTEKEYVNVPDVSDCLDMVCDIIMALKGQYYATPYTAPTFTYKPYKSVQPAKFDRYNFMEDKSWNDNKGWSDDTFYPDYPVATKTKQLCECCQEKAKLTYIYEYKMELCDKCIKDYIKPYDA
jgi:hypothetical protein